MSITDLILVCLATYRLSHMLVYEDAPLGIARHLRNLLGASESSCIEQHKTGHITSALCCINCTSVWAAAIVLALWVYAPVCVWALAASGAVVIYQRWG